MTPAVATALYLKKNNFKGLIYAIGSTEFQNTLRNYGFSVIGSVSYQSYLVRKKIEISYVPA